MDELEKRIVESSLEVRATGEKKQIVGYAAKFDKLSLPMGYMRFREKIDPAAFSEDMKMDGLDTRGLVNHDPNLILGRTISGTMKLSTDKTGLKFVIDPPDTQYARDLMTSIERGDISQCSFGFRVMPNGDEWSEDADGNLIRTLKRVSVHHGDVSPVTYPAYPDTEVNMRSLEAMAEEARKRLHPEPEDTGAGYRARQIQLAEVE